MATERKLILPGFGGALEKAMVYGDILILDMSQCATAVFTLKATTAGGSILIEQSFDGTNWAVVTTLDTVGETKKFPITDAIGLIRCTGDDSDSSSLSSSPAFDDGTVTLHVVGFNLPVG